MGEPEMRAHQVVRQTHSNYCEIIPMVASQVSTN
jgi:hypothetical protein